MSNNDTSNEPVITSYAQAPARTITANGVTYAYRELGPKGGIPVVFFVHLAATLSISSEANPLRTLKVNCEGTINVFEAALALGVSKVV